MASDTETRDFSFRQRENLIIGIRLAERAACNAPSQTE